MEHKLVLGGEQYLPFARSRVKALRATGLTYASQQYEIDGVTIKVRIAGKDSFIRLEGSQMKILSGAIKEGNVVSVPDPTPAQPSRRKNILRSYRSTPNSWDYGLKKPTAKPLGQYNDEEFLANHGSQYTLVVPSMYSGLMAPAVQIALGQGKEVTYKSLWNECHGVVRDSKGKPWLVEISSEFGVRVMRLPMSKGNASSKNDAEKEAVAMFKGVPSGGSFPTGGDLIDAVADKRVLNLLAPSEIEAYLTKTPMAQWVGWSFSPTLPEAYNVVYSNAGVIRTYLYKMAISINVDQPETVASALLTMEESGEIRAYNTTLPKIQFAAFNSVLSYVPATYDDMPGNSLAPIHVRHVGGELDVVRFKQAGYQQSHADVDFPAHIEYPFGGDWEVISYGFGPEERIISKKFSTLSSNTEQIDTYRVIGRGSRVDVGPPPSTNSTTVVWVIWEYRKFRPAGAQETLHVSQLSRDAISHFTSQYAHHVFSYKQSGTGLFNGAYNPENNFDQDAQLLPNNTAPDDPGLYYVLFVNGGEVRFQPQWVYAGARAEISLPDGTYLEQYVSENQGSYFAYTLMNLVHSCFGEITHAALIGQNRSFRTGYLIEGQPVNENPGYNFIGYIK